MLGAMQRRDELEPPSSTLEAEPRTNGGFLWRLGGLLRSVRPHQWVKNVFVLAPMVFAREMFIEERLVRSVGAFGVFCLLAGAVYLMNDIADRESDAAHPVKRHRPIASGRLPLSWAKPAALFLIVVSFVGAAFGPWKFLVTAIAYFAQNVAYSFKLKNIAYLDVAIIAAGFVLRVLAGGFATHTEVSTYLLVCTALLASFLGLGKRVHELSAAKRTRHGRQRAALQKYSLRGARWALYVTAALTVASYAAYTLDSSTIEFFGSPRLWWTTLFVALGVWRFMVLVSTRPRAESPTQEMLSDGPFVGILFGWGAVVFWIVYNLEPQR